MVNMTHLLYFLILLRLASKNEARTRYPCESTTKSNMPRIQRKDDGSSPAKKDKKSAKPEPKKRKSRPDDDDDSSVDSHGNIRGLISYSDEESSVSSYHRKKPSKHKRRAHSTEDTPSRRKKKVRYESSSSESTPPKRKHARHRRKSESESESESEAPTPSPRRKPRKAAVKALEKIREAEEKRRQRKKRAGTPTTEEEDDDDEDFVPPSIEDDSEDESVDDEELDEDEDEDEELDEDEDEELDEDEDEELDEDEDEDEAIKRSPRLGGIELLISDLGEAAKPPKPKKYKLSKEPENVRRFVKLVQTEVDPDEEDIDRDIGYFKGLTPRAQDRLLTKLHNKVEPAEPSIPLKFQILAKEVPSEVERVAMAKYLALQNIDPSTTEYYKTQQWIHGYTQLPLGIYKDLPVKLEDGTDTCQKFMQGVRENMDLAIYGHDDAKLHIMQFISSWIANPSAAGNVLSIYGAPGIGKTTLVKDGVAKALGRPFHFITLGGATDSSYLDGHSYTYEGSTWGRIVDVLIKSKCMNPVIYFDELDKVSETPKGEEINNLLIHLTDGSQNDRFQDKYFAGIDLDLSRCLFIFSHNNHEKVNPILRDRMYNIHLEGFGMKEKLVIAEQYLINQALREVNLFEKISISKEVTTYIIQEYTGEEKGVRELKRCIQTVINKLNLLRFYNDPAKVPFAIKEFALPFTLKKEHVDLFLKKRSAGIDPSIAHLYT
jgi:hypothetical protein